MKIYEKPAIVTLSQGELEELIAVQCSGTSGGYCNGCHTNIDCKKSY